MDITSFTTLLEKAFPACKVDVYLPPTPNPIDGSDITINVSYGIEVPVHSMQKTIKGMTAEQINSIIEEIMSAIVDGIKKSFPEVR